MTDITRRGTRDYDEATASKVIGVFRNLYRPGHGVQVDDLAFATGVPGRTVRQIMTDADSNGAGFVLTGGDDGYEIAEYQEDAEALTRRLLATARTLLERVERREAATEKLPLRQRGLFS